MVKPLKKKQKQLKIKEKSKKSNSKLRKVKTIKKYNDENDENSPLILRQNEIFNKLVNKKLDEITELEKNVNADLIYRYKCKTLDEKFGKYDNALNLVDNIKTGEIKLADAKNEQIRFKSNISKIKKEATKEDQKSKKTRYTILKCFTKHETRLLNFMMIILQ